jgi:hypothetical protein
MNNASIATADRVTHLKIVAVSLICATAVAGIGLAARMTVGATAVARLEANVIRTGAPVTAANNDIIIR